MGKGYPKLLMAYEIMHKWQQTVNRIFYDTTNSLEIKHLKKTGGESGIPLPWFHFTICKWLLIIDFQRDNPVRLSDT